MTNAGMVSGRSSFALKPLGDHRDRPRHNGMDGAVVRELSDLIELMDIALTVRQDATGERV